MNSADNLFDKHRTYLHSNLISPLRRIPLRGDEHIWPQRPDFKSGW